MVLAVGILRVGGPVVREVERQVGVDNADGGHRLEIEATRDQLGADQYVRLNPPQGRISRGADTLAPDATTRVLPKSNKVVAGVDTLRAETLDHRSMQDPEQLTAMNRVLWMLVACVAAERLTVDELTEVIEEDGLLRQDGHARKRRVDSQFGERFGRVRQDVDAHAERTDLRCGLEDAARNSRTLQEKRERESADTGADDDDVQIPSGLECASI